MITEILKAIVNKKGISVGGYRILVTVALFLIYDKVTVVEKKVAVIEHRITAGGIASLQQCFDNSMDPKLAFDVPAMKIYRPNTTAENGSNAFPFNPLSL